MRRLTFLFAYLKSTRTLMAAALVAMAAAMPGAGQDPKEPELKVLSATLAQTAKASDMVFKPRNSSSLLLVVRVDGAKVSDATTKNVKLIVGKRTIKMDAHYSFFPRSGGESRKYFIFSVPRNIAGALTLSVADGPPVSFEPNGTIVDEFAL